MRPSVLSLVVLPVALFSGCESESEEDREDRYSRINTVVLCEARMQSNLRAPSTADFPFASASSVQQLNATQHRLVSYVDAENAFGGTVRTRFICEVEGSGEDISGYEVTEFITE